MSAAGRFEITLNADDLLTAVSEASAETARTAAIATVARAFEGEGEAWGSDHSGDHLAAVAVDALVAVGFLPAAVAPGASVVAGPGKARATGGSS